MIDLHHDKVMLSIEEIYAIVEYYRDKANKLEYVKRFYLSETSNEFKRIDREIKIINDRALIFERMCTLKEDYDDYFFISMGKGYEFYD